MTLVYRGFLAERVGDREEEAGPLSVVVKPPGVRHANRYGAEGAWTLQVSFSPKILDAWSSEWRLGGWRWSHGGETVRPFLALLQSMRDVPLAADVESLVFELLATVGAPAVRAVGTAPGWLERARTRIGEPGDDPPRVRRLAEDAGVHPVSLTRAFRRHYGTTVTEEIRRRRVVAAARALCAGDGRLSHVALDAGFADQAHFSRDFKRVTGLTPLRYRNLARV
jgi:AraC family transcriptional regulator